MRTKTGSLLSLGLPNVPPSFAAFPVSLKGVFVMGDWLSDLDPRVALGTVMLALITGMRKHSVRSCLGSSSCG
jgi:hypothetical protein